MTLNGIVHWHLKDADRALVGLGKLIDVEGSVEEGSASWTVVALDQLERVGAKGVPGVEICSARLHRVRARVCR